MPSVWGGLPAMLLRCASLAARIGALVLSLLVVALCFSGIPFRAALLDAAVSLGGLLPQALSGVLVRVTPFGGAFRGDFAMTALLLFVLDWLFARASARGRHDIRRAS